MHGEVESGVTLNDMAVSKASVHGGLNFFAYCLVLYHLLVVEFLPPAFAAPLMRLTLGMHEMTLAIVFLVMDRLYTRRPFLIRSVIWWLLVGFVFTLYVSAFGPGAVERNQSLIIFKKILRYIIPGFVLLNTVYNWKRLKGVLWLLILSAFFATIVAFWQFAVTGTIETMWPPGGVPIISRSNPQFLLNLANVSSWRLGGPGGIARGNPNFYCMALLVVIPLSCYFYLTAKNIYLKYGCILTYSIFVMALLLSGSRSAVLGFAVICIGGIWRWKRRFLTVMVVTVILVFVVVLLHPLYRQRAASIVVGTIRRPPQAEEPKKRPPDDLAEIRLPGGFIVSEKRIAFWKAGLDIFMDHPVFGIGIVTFTRAYGERVAPAKGQPLHNSILLVFVEAGILGGTMLLVLLGVVIRTLRQLAKEAIGGIGNANASILAGALELALYGFFVNALFHDQIYRIYPYLLIIVVAILQRLTKSERNI